VQEAIFIADAGAAAKISVATTVAPIILETIVRTSKVKSA